MNDFDEYEFRLTAYTPATIPMERLAKYLVALSELFAHKSSVHFDRVEKGSTKPLMRVDREDAHKVFNRINGLRLGTAANDAIDSFDKINNLLRGDNASGSLNRRTADSFDLVLEFPGKDLPAPIKFGPFTEPASIDGELVKIGGKDQSAHATIVDLEGKSWSGEMTRELAQKIAPYLYKGYILRVIGEAKWERTEGGDWHAIFLRISDFDVLRDDTLLDATMRLRTLCDTDWSNENDIDGFISAERGANDELH